VPDALCVVALDGGVHDGAPSAVLQLLGHRGHRFAGGTGDEFGGLAGG
jgi:hypothetical protein